MADAILAARLDVLEQNLDRLEASLELIGTEVPLERERAEELYDNVNAEIQDRAHRHRRAIREMRESLQDGNDDVGQQLADAWERYAEMEVEARLLFSSCLELIGGVAFREKVGVDRDVWCIADAFSLELCHQALKQRFNYLAIPASQDAMSGSLVRTIRMRFPEWTIWSLPLIGYEFASAAIGPSREELEALRGTEVERLVAADNGATPRARMLRTACEQRVRVLLADAVATYMLGPSYACATLHLRLDPTSATDAGPSSVERARVVLTCLRAMDEENDRAHADFIDLLEQQWSDAVERSHPLGPDVDAGLLRDLEETMLPKFIDALAFLPQAARLTRRGWQQAVMFETEWREQLADRLPLRLQLVASHQIRDILNAAWLARIRVPDQADKIEPATLDACVSLLAIRQEQRGRSSDRPFPSRRI
jgi:hypothetical protein